MHVSFILAADEDNAIGAKGVVPWRMRSDLRRFKRLTTGHHILMGRKTWESLGKPLPGRVNLVVTRQAGYRAPGAVVCSSPEEGVETARRAGEEELFVIGGARMYAALLPLAERIYLSRIHTRTPAADTFFPLDFLSPPEWVCRSRENISAGEGDEYGYTFEVWEREPQNP